MKRTLGTFYIKSLLTSVAVLVGFVVSNASVAAVAQRQQTTVAAKPDNSARGKMRSNPGAATIVATADSIVDDTPTETVEDTDEYVASIAVDNKSNAFDSVMSELNVSGGLDSDADERAEKIRQMRDALDNKSNAISHTMNVGSNACNTELRKCMAEKCGDDFTKCDKDSETAWNMKVEACRSKTPCSAHEFALLAPEIKADRDMNVKMSFYQSVLDCGGRYNKCIFDNCGSTFDKCIAKSDGDSAIKKCDNIAKECKQQDSGMPARTMGIFGTLRNEKSAQAKEQEKRLFELRDLMRKECEKFGARFDERTLDCVYTVNFFAGEGKDSEKPIASKKLYAGDAFQCTPDWFGVDVTTYKENAYRLTRSEKAASSAAAAAGLGTAAGLYSSGAFGRRVDEKGWNMSIDKGSDKETKNTPTQGSQNNTPSNNKSNNGTQNTSVDKSGQSQTSSGGLNNSSASAQKSTTGALGRSTSNINNVTGVNTAYNIAKQQATTGTNLGIK